jgi:uncharacterized membrane protein
MRKFWKILLGVVVAIVVLGAIGFGIARHWMWNGRFADWGRMAFHDRWMQDDYEGDMPCEDNGSGACEGSGFMPYGGFFGRGMHRMPFIRSMPGMYGGSWFRPGFSPFSWLLLIALIIVGVLYFRQRKELKQYSPRDTGNKPEPNQSEVE